MKISGPGAKPPGGIEGPSGAEGAGEAPKVGGKDFAEKAERAAETGRAAEAGRAGAPSLVADISADLQAGRITPAAAIEKVIDRVIEQQVGANAPAAVREQVGAALRRALEDDPLLLEKLRAL